MAKAKSAAAGVESKVGNDIKNKFKQLKKTLSKENIKAKLTRKSSKEISVLTEKEGAANMNSSPPPRTLPQTATKDVMASKSPGVTPIRKRGAGAGAGDPGSTPPPPQVKAALEAAAKTTKTPQAPPSVNSKKKTATSPSSSSPPAAGDNKNTLLKCSRVLGAAIALLVLKSALFKSKSKI